MSLFKSYLKDAWSVSQYFSLRNLKYSCSMGNLQQADTEDCTKMSLTKDIKLQLPILIFFSHISKDFYLFIF